jgi:hypothetical protein
MDIQLLDWSSVGTVDSISGMGTVGSISGMGTVGSIGSGVVGHCGQYR